MDFKHVALQFLSLLFPISSWATGAVLKDPCETVLSAQELIAKSRGIEFSKGELQALIRHDESREGFYDNPKFYEILESHLPNVRQMIRSWNSELDFWLDNVRRSMGEKYIVLLADPGILTRLQEFIDFATIYLEAHPNVSTYELRKAFSNSLGFVRLFRGMVLTEVEALAIETRGLMAPGTRKPELLLKSITSSFDTHSGLRDGNPYNQIKARIGGLGPPQPYDGDENMFMSFTEYIEVAKTIGYWDSGSPSVAGKNFYLFEVNVPRLSVVETRRMGTFRHLGFGPSRDADPIIDFMGNFLASTRDPGVENFVPYWIPKRFTKVTMLPEVPPQHGGAVPDSKSGEYFAKIGKTWKTGDLEHRRRYAEGEFFELYEYSRDMEAWILDSNNPFDMRVLAAVSLIAKVKSGTQVDIFWLQDLRMILEKLSSRDRATLLYWAGSRKDIADIIRSFHLAD